MIPKPAFTLVTITACLVHLAACGRPEPGPTSAPSAVDESAPDEESAPGSEPQAPAEEPEEELPTGTIRVSRVSGSDSAPATAGREPTTAAARVDGASVLLSLTDFVYYCSPAPNFTARMEDARVVVQAEPPDGPATRCIGPHSAELRLDGIPAGEHVLSVRTQHGREVASTQVTVPPE